MTIDIHYDYDKLSINGVAKWCVASRWAAVRAEGESNLGMQKRDRHTLHHNIYIVSLAGGRENKQKRDRQTDIHFIIIYISSAWQGEGKISKNVTDKQTYTSSLYIYHQLGRGKAK